MRGDGVTLGEGLVRCSFAIHLEFLSTAARQRPQSRRDPNQGGEPDWTERPLRRANEGKFHSDFWSKPLISLSVNGAGKVRIHLDFIGAAADS